MVSHAASCSRIRVNAGMHSATGLLQADEHFRKLVTSLQAFLCFLRTPKHSLVQAPSTCQVAVHHSSRTRSLTTPMYPWVAQNVSNDFCGFGFRGLGQHPVLYSWQARKGIELVPGIAGMGQLESWHSKVGGIRHRGRAYGCSGRKLCHSGCLLSGSCTEPQHHLPVAIPVTKYDLPAPLVSHQQ